MQILHNFHISIKKYYELGIENDFPIVTECPFCHDLLYKHGFYQRYVITSQKRNYRILIRRYKCHHCGRTVSILPSFLFPYFQRSLDYIVDCIKEYLLFKKFMCYRRAVFFYLKRFKDNTPGLIFFFRDLDNSLIPFRLSRIKKAIKLIKMIKSADAQILSQRYHNHFNKCFMAL